MIPIIPLIKVCFVSYYIISFEEVLWVMRRLCFAIECNFLQMVVRSTGPVLSLNLGIYFFNLFVL